MCFKDSWSSDILITKSIKWTFDFVNDSVEKLHHIKVPFDFLALRTALCHGIATWFDVLFDGDTYVYLKSHILYFEVV